MADWLSKLSQFVFAYELEIFKEYGMQLKAPRRRCGAEWTGSVVWEALEDRGRKRKRVNLGNHESRVT